MDHRSEFKTATNGTRVELATITFRGREYTALGSVVARGVVIGYANQDETQLQTWEGALLGTLRRVGTTHGHTKIACYRAVIGGERYHGRGCSRGMIVRLHKCR